MKTATPFFSLSLALILSGCSKAPEIKYKEIKVEDVAEDLRVPAKIWDLLEFKEVDTHEETKAAKEKKEGTITSAKEINFAEVNVFLTEKNSGIVKEEALKIALPQGGGEVDLAQFISEQKGSFYVSFEFPEFKDSTAQKVLFLSKARKRRIDDKVIGAGCNQFFDITSAFMKAMKGEGLKVNTTRERYTTVLGGTFFFTAQKAGSTYIAQVTFKDSKHPNLFCEAP